MDQSPAPSGKIVVGVDGSESSKDALRWALRQAELSGSHVEAVIAWQYPVMVGGFGFAPVSAMMVNFDENAAKALADSVAEVVDPASSVLVSSAVVEGPPAQVLLRACKDADLLVVGSRGHGGFAEALLGSVSQHCVHHAPCPVVIVRDHVAV
jgi:nucleotide-binding universal stress UspA family protein